MTELEVGMFKQWRWRWRGRLRTISFSFFGQSASVEFSQSERERARSILLRLEDHRVLHAPYDLEEENGSWGSIEALRTYLNEQVERCESEELREQVRAMRAAVRQWLTDVESARRLTERTFREVPPNGRDPIQWARDRDRVQWAYGLQALGMLRGRVGVAIAEIGRKFDIPIDGDLGHVTPPDVDDSERGARLSPLYFDET
ncbi:hypothetical protein AB0E00_20760 [Streptomyces sp. NPDC048110]|uniref:hypothetical protein n=1 Tax=Streptomyces sp. NPDC048110 TaxID=3155483 RepID=UPI0034112B30